MQRRGKGVKERAWSFEWQQTLQNEMMRRDCAAVSEGSEARAKRRPGGAVRRSLIFFRFSHSNSFWRRLHDLNFASTCANQDGRARYCGDSLSKRREEQERDRLDRVCARMVARGWPSCSGAMVPQTACTLASRSKERAIGAFPN